jgi:myotubularin-related protein 5/13
LPNNEHQTYAGYLKKQGALFKQWKERYFVLDSVKHQLRYYDCANDLVAKGVIDLSEVESINQDLSSAYQQLIQQQQQQSSSSQLANSTTKKALNTINVLTGSSFGESSDANSCFVLKTSKRVYYFCANSPQDAYKWINQLQACCTDS